MYDNLSALNAYGDGLNIIAHNIANMNTAGYEARTFAYGAGPADTVEVQVSPPNSGLPEGVGQDRVTLSMELGPEARDMGVAPPFTNTVDLARETVNMMVAGRGFEANVAAITARAELGDAALGLVIDRRA